MFDAIVTGETLEFEKFKRFENMTAEEITSFSLKEYDDLEEKRWYDNAFSAAKELANWIDGAPVLSEYMQSMVAEPTDYHHYLFGDLLKDYNSATAMNKKAEVPGSGYIEKLLDFSDNHFHIGELYMEYIKGSCASEDSAGELCDFCVETPWVGPKMDRIPCPYPDYSVLPEFHYKDVFDTPKAGRTIDDYNPRHALRQAFAQGESVDLDDFSQKFIVSKDLAKDYIDHLIHLQMLDYLKVIRAKERDHKKQTRQEKPYEEYEWGELCRSGDIAKLTKQELSKYLNHHRLSDKGIKADMVKRITYHMSQSAPTEITADPADLIEDESSESGDEDEAEIEDEDEMEVIQIGSDAEETDEEESSEDEEEPTVKKPRPRRSKRRKTDKNSEPEEICSDSNEQEHDSDIMNSSEAKENESDISSDDEPVVKIPTRSKRGRIYKANQDDAFVY